MPFIVIETWPDVANATIATDEDGNNEVFETKADANTYIEDNLQEGIAVEIK